MDTSTPTATTPTEPTSTTTPTGDTATETTDTGEPAPPPPSCANLTSTCAGGDCCASLEVPATTFDLGRTAGIGEDCVCTTCDAAACGGACGPLTCDQDEQPSVEATISAFRLDRFEVTVGRFRAWVDAGAPVPAAGAGLHAHLPTGQLLLESGWNEGWAVSDDWDFDLYCSTNLSTWTPDPGANEARPINCVDWFEAYAFCIWDGGFLPTEAEWELAASGGEDRVFPWSDPPADDTITSNEAMVGALGDLMDPVGFTPGGQGRWGHDDLASSVQEWILDLRPNRYRSPCVDCFSDVGQSRVVRGYAWQQAEDGMRAASRWSAGDAGRSQDRGFRCARTPD